MKTKTYLLALLCSIIGLSIAFASCSKDDDDETDIAGTWVNGQTTMVLGRDGSYLTYYGINPNSSDSQYRKGSYSYNSSLNLLVVNVVAVPNHNSAYQHTYIVQSLTKSTLVLLYTDGDVEGYYTRK